MATELLIDPPLSASSIEVLFVLMPGSLILDWAGPAEALRIANQRLLAQGKAERFVLRFVGPDADTVSSVGARLAGLEPLPEGLNTAGGPTRWIVLVGLPGATICVDDPAGRAVQHWLRGLRLVSDRLELVTVCAGTLLAAHAGLLPGRRVTTHHQHLDELREVEPRCEVVANRVFVEDSPVWSSAGVTTGIDLLLQRIALTCGEAIAAQVAQGMVVALRRGAHDPELSPFLNYRNHLHPALHRVQDAVSLDPRQDWSVPRMAAIAFTSPRHLTRLFMEHTQIAPLQYLRRIRLTVAQSALEAGHSVNQAAELAGFSSDTQLRRTWHQLGQAGAPSQARRH
jgi:transcriptional regulator GlxA family with amidase domain